MPSLTLPFDFALPGPPVSLQTKNKTNLRQWKSRVKAAAEAVAQSATPRTEELKVKITFFHESDSPDVDNIIKPIQDALVGVVYLDDCQVAATGCTRRDIDGAYRIRRAPQCLVDAMSAGDDFIHVTVDLYQETTEI